MSRHAVTLRPAVSEDAAALIQLWQASTIAPDKDGPQTPWLPVTPTVGEAATAIEQATANPGNRMLVALVDGDIAGTALFEVRNAGPLSLTKIVVISDFQVSPDHRRRGVAAALLAASSTFADEHHAVVVMAAVKAHLRETHRYLTKLGFREVAVVRATGAEELRSRMAVKAGGDTGRLVAVRRGMRRRGAAARLDAGH